MITPFDDSFDTLFNLQRALEARLTSDWLHDQTASPGPFPPINVSNKATTSWRSSNCRESKKPACRSKPKKTRSASRARRLPPILKTSASIGASVYSVTSTERFRYPLNSVQTVSKRNTRTGFWRFSYHERSAPNHDPSRSTERIVN